MGAEVLGPAGQSVGVGQSRVHQPACQGGDSCRLGLSRRRINQARNSWCSDSGSRSSGTLRGHDSTICQCASALSPDLDNVVSASRQRQRPERAPTGAKGPEPRAPRPPRRRAPPGRPRLAGGRLDVGVVFRIHDCTAENESSASGATGAPSPASRECRRGRRARLASSTTKASARSSGRRWRARRTPKAPGRRRHSARSQRIARACTPLAR